MTELGERLKQERESKGLSLEELQDITKIQKRYLIGIEEGNYSMMPGKFYVRAFIKQYAEAVGLEPDEIFEQYKNEIPSTHDDLPQHLSRVQSRKNISNRSSKVLDLFPKVLIGIIVVGAVVLLWYWLVLSAEDRNNETVNEENNPVQIDEPDDLEDQGDLSEEIVTDEDSTEPNEDESSAEEPSNEEEAPVQELTVAETNNNATIYDLQNADSFELKIVSTGASWVRVKNGDGKVLYEGTLQQNDSQTLDFTSESEAAIRIGSVPSTELYINGEKLEYAISPNERTTQNISIRYTKNEQ